MNDMTHSYYFALNSYSNIVLTFNDLNQKEFEDVLWKISNTIWVENFDF